MIRRLTAVALLAVTIVAGLVRDAGAQERDGGTVDRVLILSMPDVTWGDLDLEELPNLRGLFAQSTIADMSVRGVRRRPNLGDGYVTIGAGTRSVGRTLDQGQCFSATEPFEEGLAREAMARRAGVPLDDISDGSVVCLAQPAIAARNDNLLFDAEVGLLGDTLAQAGVHRAVIGNADRAVPLGEAGYERQVGLALADRNGIVPGGSVGNDLLELDPAAPFGLRASRAAYTATFEEEWRDRSVVLVEASDLVRFDAYRGTIAVDARDAFQRSLLRAFDALVGDLLTRVGDDDAVLVVGPAHGGARGRLTLAALRAPGVEPGFARSAYTRRSSIVSIVDVGPTVLSLLGLERPDAMEGKPFEAGSSGGDFADRYDALVDVDDAARFRDGVIAQVTTWFVVLQVVLTGAALIAFQRIPRALVGVELGALTLLGFLPATYLAGLFPFHEWPAVFYWLFLFGFGALSALAIWLATPRDGATTLVAALSLVVGVLMVDVMLGARLQFNTALGYSPTVAGRFAGIGNLAYSQLAAGTVLLAGLVAFVVGRRRGAWVAIGLLGLAILVDGAPFWGADVGGVLSMVPAYALAATLLLGWRVRARTVVWGVLGAVALIGVFAALDASRPEEDRTHLGRLVYTTSDGGWDSFATVVQRKVSANLDVLFGSIWTIMLPIVLTGIAYLVYRAPGRLRGVTERIPPLRASLAGVAVVAGLGFALNDSGIAIPGVMLGVLTPVLVVVTIRRERADREIALTGDAAAVREPARA